MVIGAVLLMVTAILSQTLTGKWKIILWIVFTILLIAYTIVGINMELDRKIEKGKETANVSALNDKNKQIYDLTQQLLKIVQSPNFAKDQKTLSTINEVKNNLSSLGNKPKAILQFTFWPLGPNSKIIDKTRVPIKNGIIEVPFSFKNNSTEPAKNGEVWIQICDKCRFAEETVGFKKLKPEEADVAVYLDTVRKYPFCLFAPGEYFTPATLKIIPPLGYHSFPINFRYKCETCPPVDNEHPQQLTVNY